MNSLDIKDIYKSYKKENRKVLFPNGENQLLKIVSSLARICNLNKEEITYPQIKDLTNIYVDTVIKKAAHQEDVDIILAMPKKHGEYLKSIDDACKVLAYFLLQSGDPNYELKELNNEEFNEVYQMYVDSFMFMDKNQGLENKYLKDKDYGLVKEKPIYTHGQTGTENYFSLLSGKNKEEIIYEYEDTLEVEGINGFVDVYKLSDSNNKEITKLYINRYGNFNSNNAPRGFKLEKVEIEKLVKDQEKKVVKKMRKSAKGELILGAIVLIIAIILLIIRRK